MGVSNTQSDSDSDFHPRIEAKLKEVERKKARELERLERLNEEIGSKILAFQKIQLEIEVKRREIENAYQDRISEILNGFELRFN